MQRDFEKVPVDSRAQLCRWLVRHHTQTDSVWLNVWKKPDPRYIPYDQIVEEALCFGWVDSLPGKLDATRSMLLLSSRRSKSAWSQVNKLRAERMIAARLMTKSGLQRIEEAKRDGLWDKLNSVEALVVPPDLKAAFAQHPYAARHWEAFPRSLKRGILEWIEQAKQPETRARRIDETGTLAGRNERANQWRSKRRWLSWRQIVHALCRAH
jgi:uncharacterized protein YdeI (YjbR/CyaY-like superfamily)